MLFSYNSIFYELSTSFAYEFIVDSTIIQFLNMCSNKDASFLGHGNSKLTAEYFKKLVKKEQWVSNSVKLLTVLHMNSLLTLIFYSNYV